MAALDAIVIPALAPERLLSLQRAILARVCAPGAAATLLLNSDSQSALGLGRYHFYGAPQPARAAIWRRISGGRAMATGAGVLHLTLVAPSMTSLLAPRDRALLPEQVINRQVRGILAGLRALGLNCFYPGRDTVTIGRREIARCAFEVDRAGAMLFEASIALATPDAAFGESGPGSFVAAASSTTLAGELGRAVAFEDAARAMIAGYAAALAPATVRELDARERAAIFRDGERGLMESSCDLDADAALDRRAELGAQLGTIEARLRVAPDGRIERARVGGDFIANSPAIAALHQALVGVRHQPDTILGVVERIFDGRGNFILGIGPVRNLARLIASAA